MKKKYSIKKNQDIQRILNKARFTKGRYIVVYVTKNDTDENKIAFLVGKKLGHAPYRNQVKRRMRVATQGLWNDLLPGHNILIMARPLIKDIKPDEISRELAYLLKKHDIMKK